MLIKEILRVRRPCDYVTSGIETAEEKGKSPSNHKESALKGTSGIFAKLHFFAEKYIYFSESNASKRTVLRSQKRSDDLMPKLVTTQRNEKHRFF